MQKKAAIIKCFNAAKLEDFLKSSTKNVALDLVQTLIPDGDTSVGVLIEIEQQFNLA